jgi:hypothetical protein
MIVFILIASLATVAGVAVLNLSIQEGSLGWLFFGLGLMAVAALNVAHAFSVAMRRWG